MARACSLFCASRAPRCTRLSVTSSLSCAHMHLHQYQTVTSSSVLCTLDKMQLFISSAHEHCGEGQQLT